LANRAQEQASRLALRVSLRSRRVHNGMVSTKGRRMWQHIDRGCRYDWRVRPAAQARLLEILPSFDAAIFNTSSEELNVSLNAKLSSLLKSNNKRSRQLAEWIIKYWGGVNRGLNDDPWMEVLGAFENDAIDRFIDHHGAERISSWSKLLAFANPERYAIFDALTSVALNCALRRLGDQRRFHMPPGQQPYHGGSAAIVMCRQRTESGN
jgi:hypothetical protein